MSARETLNRWVEAMQILCGHDDNPGPERRAGYEETRRKMLDAAYAELLAEAKNEVVAWLVKKDREGAPVGHLASKVDRGAVRIFLGTGHYRDAMDAHRAEVLNEAADMVHAMADPRCTCGGCDSCAARGYAKALREKASEEATAAAATATPTDTNRRARLLNEMTFDGGRWKSGDVVTWYGTQGLTWLGANTARRDLATLRDSGAITQHDEKGVRFYTVSQKGSRT